jgi:hypothetical protein
VAKNPSLAYAAPNKNMQTRTDDQTVVDNQRHQATWEKYYRKLQDFASTHGHMHVPANYLENQILLLGHEATLRVATIQGW